MSGPLAGGGTPDGHTVVHEYVALHGYDGYDGYDRCVAVGGSGPIAWPGTHLGAGSRRDQG